MVQLCKTVNGSIVLSGNGCKTFASAYPVNSNLFLYGGAGGFLIIPGRTDGISFSENYKFLTWRLI